MTIDNRVRKHSIKLISAFLVLLMFAAPLTGCTAQNAGSSDRSLKPSQTPSAPSETPSADAGTVLGEPIKEGAPAPDFSYTTVDGISGKLSELRGKVVFLNLWASWCGPCVKEMPDIATLKADYPELEVLAVNVSDDPKDARGFISDSGYDFRWVLDEQGTVSVLYPTDGIPYTVIIDRDGVVSSIFLGSPPDAYGTYERALKQAGL
jgi:cytochrome c-type biogenesis protein